MSFSIAMTHPKPSSPAKHNGEEISVSIRRPPILMVDRAVSEQDIRSLTEVERAVLWEVDMARRCVHNFGKMSSAHAIVLSLLVTVNLIGFLQPPKGWNMNENNQSTSSSNKSDDNLRTVSIMFNTAAIRCFSITSGLSLYSAITGLLFYIYCSYTSILPLGTFPFPMGPGEKYDPRAIELLHQTRAFLRCVALPAVSRRSLFHFTFLTLSLLFSGIAFISSGSAAVGPGHVHWVIIGPALPGCACVLISLGLAVRKYWKELRFDKRFDFFWKNVARIDEKCIPPLVPIDRDDYSGLDPIPFRWATCWIAPYECKHGNPGKHFRPSQILDRLAACLMAPCGYKPNKHVHPSHTHMVRELERERLIEENNSIQIDVT